MYIEASLRASYQGCTKTRRLERMAATNRVKATLSAFDQGRDPISATGPDPGESLIVLPDGTQISDRPVNEAPAPVRSGMNEGLRILLSRSSPGDPPCPDVEALVGGGGLVEAREIDRGLESLP